MDAKLYMVRSTTTNNPMVYRFETKRLETFACRGMDLRTALTWYGVHVATKFKDGWYFSKAMVKVIDPIDIRALETAEVV